MHIPDAYLSPGTQAAAFAVMTPFWVVAARKTRAKLSARQVPLLSVGAAFAFAIQMFNIPAVGGTTAHALGTALLAILLGPWAAIVAMTLTLTIQAFFFGDGGILSLGANCWDMAVVSAFVSFGVYRLLSVRSTGKNLGAAALAAYLGTAAASLSAGLLLGAQPLVAHDALGKALFFPFGWAVSIPAMVNIHLLVAAPAEAIITAGALAYLWKNFPDLVGAGVKAVKVTTPLRLGKVLAFVLILTPLGLVASGQAWGEWDASALAKMVGYIPAGAATATPVMHPLLPDYGFAGQEGTPWAVVGYLVSGLLGIILILTTLKFLARGRPGPTVAAASSSGPGGDLPLFLSSPNRVAESRAKAGRPWLDKTLTQMREMVSETTLVHKISENNGLLQGVSATWKILATVALLICASFFHSPLLLLLMSLASVAAAGCSRISLRSFIGRVVGTAAFFGLILALPLSLEAVSHGPVAATVLGVQLSSSGLQQGALMLLRLCTGIALALLLTSTTKQRQLVDGLKRMRMPSLFVTGLMLTYRYLFVLTDTMAEMVLARKSRQVGCIRPQQARLYTGTATAVLFAKSMAFSEESFNAMRSRLFDWEPRPTSAPPAHLLRWIWGTCLAAVLLGGIVHAL